MRVNNIDTWQNKITKIGTQSDKSVYTVQNRSILKKTTIDNLYDCDDIPARFIDIVPREGLHKFVSFHSESGDFDGLMQKSCKSLLCKEQFQEAWRLSRLYGGSLLFLNIEDGKEPHLPFNPEENYKIISLTPIDRYEIIVDPQDVYSDLRHRKFGKPEFYTHRSVIGKKSIKIHESRVILFLGDSVTPNYYRTHFFNQSYLQRPYDSIRDYNTGYRTLTGILQEYRLMIIKLNSLAENIRKGQKKVVEERIQDIRANMNVVGAVVLDKEDDYDIKGGSLEGISDVIKALKDRLQASFDIPHTILFNEAPAASIGSNSGNGESTQWANYISGVQIEFVEPKLQHLFEVILGASNGPTNGKIPSYWSFKFNPLYEISQADAMAARKAQSEIDTAYYDIGVLGSSEIRKSRFEKGFSFETALEDGPE